MQVATFFFILLLSAVSGKAQRCVMEFVDILKEILAKYNNNQSEFAAAIGVKQPQVSEWLKGKCKPSYEVLKSIVVNTDTDPYFLLGIGNDFQSGEADKSATSIA